MTRRPTFAALERGRPPLPAETCPLLDRTSTLADAIAADVDRIEAELLEAGDVEHADELGAVSQNLAELRTRLEEIREQNSGLRTAVGYWRDGARAIDGARHTERNEKA